MNRIIEKEQSNPTDERELLYALMNGIPFCMSLWNSKHEILACNSEVLRLFEIDNAEEYITHFFRFSPEYQADGKKSHEKVKEILDEAFLKGRLSMNWIHCKKNGELIPAEVIFSRIPFQNEFIVVSYTNDLRQQLAQEEKNRKFNMRVKGLLDASPLCLNLWDKDYQNTMCNKEAVKLFELSNEQEYIERFFSLSPDYQPDGILSADKAKEKITQAFEIGRSQFLWTHCKLNGELIPAEITLVRIQGLGDEGEDMVAGYTRDLRPQILVEKAEKIASQRIQAVLDATPLICLLWNMEEEIIDCNQVAVAMFESKNKQELMREFFNFIPEYQPDGTLSINKMKEKFEECRNGLSHAFEWMYRKRNGEDVPCEVKLVKLSHDSEEDIIVAYSRDLRELKKTLEINERLTRRANFDVLTECYSRAYFMEQVEAYLTDHKEEDNFSLFIIDIDDFKNVNDTYGHNIGDKTLKAVMQKAAEELPEDALTGRFGGDEFLIFIRNRTQKELEDIALQLVEAVAGIELFSGSHAFHVTISVGAVMWKQEYHNLDEMMKRADDALYMAKKQGKNCNVVW